MMGPNQSLKVYEVVKRNKTFNFQVIRHNFIWAEVKQQSHEKVSSIFSLMQEGSEADTEHMCQKAWKARSQSHKYSKDNLTKTKFYLQAMMIRFSLLI